MAHRHGSASTRGAPGAGGGEGGATPAAKDGRGGPPPDLRRGGQRGQLEAVGEEWPDDGAAAAGAGSRLRTVLRALPRAGGGRLSRP